VVSHADTWLRTFFPYVMYKTHASDLLLLTLLGLPSFLLLQGLSVSGLCSRGIIIT
jgi:hypothetical protein